MSSVLIEFGVGGTYKWWDGSMWQGGYRTFDEARVAAFQAQCHTTPLSVFGTAINPDRDDLEVLIEGALRLAAAVQDEQDTKVPLDMLMTSIEGLGLLRVVYELIDQENEE